MSDLMYLSKEDTENTEEDIRKVLERFFPDELVWNGEYEGVMPNFYVPYRLIKVTAYWKCFPNEIVVIFIKYRSEDGLVIGFEWEVDE